MPNQADINCCLDHLQANFGSIKNLYAYLATHRGPVLSSDEKSSYPFISEARIKDFCLEVGILEKLGKKAAEEPAGSLKIKKGKTAKNKKAEGLSVKTSAQELKKAESVLENTPAETS